VSITTRPHGMRRQTACPIVERAARRRAAASRISAQVRFRSVGASSSPSASVHVSSEPLPQSSPRPALSSSTPQPIDASCVAVKLPQAPAPVESWLLLIGGKTLGWPPPLLNEARFVEGTVPAAGAATMVAIVPMAADGGAA